MPECWIAPHEPVAWLSLKLASTMVASVLVEVDIVDVDEIAPPECAVQLVNVACSTCSWPALVLWIAPDDSLAYESRNDALTTRITPPSLMSEPPFW